MHLLIPYASVSDPDCRAQFPLLDLPTLAALLARLAPDAPDRGDDHSLSPPHERALARVLGLPAADGRIPWAAHARGAPAALACAWFTPCHWSVGMEQVLMLAPDQLELAEAESRALLAALAPLAAEDGIALHYEAPLRWRAEGAAFADLACPSLDRVIGRSLTDWLPALAPPLRRLQSEAQMLFYTHPVTDARDARRLPAVNSLWVSGAGALPAPPPPVALPDTPQALREAALAGAWDRWADAWHALDAGPLAQALAHLERGGELTLTLCGERHAQTWRPGARRGWLAAARHWLRPPAPAWKTLETL